MSSISIIIPFLNEAENISRLCEQLNSFCSKNISTKWEVVFVNDGSTDQSVELLKNYPHQHYSCKIISLSKNYGSHAALRAGISKCTGERISFMYADLQDPLDLLLRMNEEFNKDNYNIVWACRDSLPTGFVDKTFSTWYSKLMKKFVNKDYPEKGFDILMFDKKVKNCLDNNVEANSSIFLQILTLGFAQTTLYYHKEKRQAGKSKWTLSKKIKLLIDSFVSFSYFPIRMVTIVGIFIFLCGIVYSGYLIYRKIFVGDLTHGWAILGTILMLGFGITNIALGIIAEYLWRTLDASRKRPVFIIDDIIDLHNENKN